MKWLAARAYEQLQTIFSDETLIAELGIKSVVIGQEAFPSVDGQDGLDLLDALPAVVITGEPGGDAVTYSNIVHHHQAFRARVWLHLAYDPDIEDPVTASNDMISRLLQELVKYQAPVALTDGWLYSIEPDSVNGHDRELGRFWEDVGLPAASASFDVTIKAEPN